MTARFTTRLAALAALPAALLLTASVPATAAEGQAYQVDLTQMNNSGAKGTAMLSVEGRNLTVKIESDGLVPNQPSAQHIHGSTKGIDFHCPDQSADKDGDGIVSNTEATPTYGDINISLTTEGDTSPDSGLAVDRMPKADARGHVSYERTIAVSQDVVDHLKDLHIVEHGIDPNKNKKFDFGAGKSELDPKLPQEATAPGICGMVMGAAIGSMPVGGVETGGGTPALQSSATLASGAAVLAGAAGAAVLIRRRRVRSAGQDS